jgi:hypothetical protein
MALSRARRALLNAERGMWNAEAGHLHHRSAFSVQRSVGGVFPSVSRPDLPSVSGIPLRRAEKALLNAERRMRNAEPGNSFSIPRSRYSVQRVQGFPGGVALGDALMGTEGLSARVAISSMPLSTFEVMFLRVLQRVSQTMRELCVLPH